MGNGLQTVNATTAESMISMGRSIRLFKAARRQGQRHSLIVGGTDASLTVGGTDASAGSAWSDHRNP